VKAWLLLVLDAQARDELWETLKVPAALRPDAGGGAAVLPSPAQLRAGGGAIEVLLQMPMFEDFDGAPRSLDELARRQAQVGRLRRGSIAGGGAGSVAGSRDRVARSG
jgi:hypothetical protein